MGSWAGPPELEKPAVGARPPLPDVHPGFLPGWRALGEPGERERAAATVTPWRLSLLGARMLV